MSCRRKFWFIDGTLIARRLFFGAASQRTSKNSSATFRDFVPNFCKRIVNMRLAAHQTGATPVFVFDELGVGGCSSWRMKYLKGYKERPGYQSEAQRVGYESRIRLINERFLPFAGVVVCRSQAGLEADDTIAVLAAKQIAIAKAARQEAEVLYGDDSLLPKEKRKQILGAKRRNDLGDIEVSEFESSYDPDSILYTQEHPTPACGKSKSRKAGSNGKAQTAEPNDLATPIRKRITRAGVEEIDTSPAAPLAPTDCPSFAARRLALSSEERPDVNLFGTPDPSDAVTVISSDKDYLQLMRLGIRVIEPKAMRYWTDESVKEKHGVVPERMAEYLAIGGDTPDCVPGVNGFGEKSVAQLFDGKGLERMMMWEILELSPEELAKRTNGLAARKW